MRQFVGPRSFSLALFLMLAACGGGGDNGNPASPSGADGSGSGGLPACDDLRSGVFSATIDGSPWTAGKTLPIAGLTAVPDTTFGRPAIAIAGNSCDDTGLVFAFLAVVATRSVGDGSGTNAKYLEDSLTTTQKQWNAIRGSTGGSGTVTVLSISATRVTGTFSFTLVPNTATGATGTVRVTSGVFRREVAVPASVVC